MKIMIALDILFNECTSFDELANSIYSEQYEGHYFQDITLITSKNDCNATFVLKAGFPILKVHCYEEERYDLPKTLELISTIPLNDLLDFEGE
ncbi:hypothetical protein J2Z48_002663 [Croceifilum oryzae]|uniref:Uncharacterized protein n=1 Tax=Croceifilum oryzae TaxID=1553429 RepID=A0AAJ1TQ51_9BACL|nr:hypothetical protein [Croceifilum oryzae]MDQ0418471.1 hypothetical protein [Croceifilum oryzae]